MNSLLQDLRFSLRLIARNPGFSAVAILTLTIAIGVNSAIFSLINGLVLRPLAPREPQRLVSLFNAREGAKRDYRQFSWQEYQTLREAPEVFPEVTAVNFTLGGVGRDNGEAMHRGFMFVVADNFFTFMGVQPAAGRFFTPEEGKPNANLPVVVASYALWQRMGGGRDFVGSTLRVNGRPHTVIGVAPQGFSGISALIAPEVWLPLGLFAETSSPFSDARAITDLAHPTNYTLNVMARLAPGLTPEAAQARLPVLAQRLTALQPPDAAGGARELQLRPPSRFSISTSPGDDGPISLMSGLLLGMAAIVLVIASLNLANMFLARGTARAREMAVRLALGASRSQLVRQLFFEGLTLAAIGGALGLLLSYASNRLLESSFTGLLGSMNFSLTAHLAPDGLALAVTFGFCLLATLVFSFGPALKAARADLVHDLKAQAGDPAVHGRWNRFFAPRHLLVMAQMTLSLVLLFSAGLFLRGALKAGGLAPGFRPDGVGLAEMDFSLGHSSPADDLRRMLAAADRARQLPGVEAAGLTSLIPYGNITNDTRVMPASAAPAVKTDASAPDPGVNGLYGSITRGYLASIGVRLLRGRDFTEAESRDRDSPRVAIVDEEMAKKLFPDRDALGQRIRYTQPPADGSPAEMEIVGIAGNHRHDIGKDAGGRRVYVPLAQTYTAGVFLSVRFANPEPAAVAASLATLRKELRALDPDLPVLQYVPFTSLMDRSIALWVIRLGAVLFGVFGGIALLLAVVGVYGVKAYAVARRTREIGIRMALGAEPGAVFALVLRQGLLQTALSVLVGTVLALGAGQVFAKILYEVSPTDPLALGGAAVLLAAAAFLACWLPARRATRISPVTALRTE